MERPIFTEDELNLIDYLDLIWNRKWMIIIPTIILVIIVGIRSFLQPKAWEIDAIIVPSKYIIQTEQGAFREIIVTDPIQIVSQINQNAYDNLIAADLNMNIKELPKLKAENIEETQLVRISTRANDVEKARQVLNSLFIHLKSEMDKKIEVEIKGLDTQIGSKKNIIKSKEIEIENEKNAIKIKKLLIEDRNNDVRTKQNRIKDKENVIKTKENEIKLKNNEIKLQNLNIESKEIEKKRVEEEINTLNNKLTISEEREVAIKEEMKEVKDRINKIEEEQRKVLKKRSNKNALAILLYSNEIQNNLRYYNTLDEKLTDERLTQENINLTIQEKKETSKQIDNQVEQIRTQINDIETEIDNIKTQIDDINTQINDINNQIDSINNEIGKINNEINTINNTITIKNNEIENINSEITLIEEKKARIDYAQLIKEPTSSLSPVSPKKRRDILIAFFFGLLIFTAFSFLFEYIKKQGLISKG